MFIKAINNPTFRKFSIVAGSHHLKMVLTTFVQKNSMEYGIKHKDKQNFEALSRITS